jgi:tripartite-type tricarboxylate transporter receptor subunit TctC
MRAPYAIVVLLSCLLLNETVQAQQLQDWAPSRLVKLVVPATPGGSLDLVGRVVAHQLSQDLSQQVIVENRPGANGLVAIPEALRAPPDGHTIIMVTTTMVAVNPAVFQHIRYDAIKDFAPIGTLVVAPAVLIVTPSFPANNLKDFIAIAKAKPGSLNYASSSNGAFSHLTFEMLKERAGINLGHVPFKGEAAALFEIVSGRVPAAILTLSSALPFINDGRLKALGVLSPQRLTELPQIPTMEEQGLSGFSPQLWYGLVVAKATPEPVVAALSRAVNRVISKPETKASFAKQSLALLRSTPDEFMSRIRADILLYGNIVKSAGIRVE